MTKPAAQLSVKARRRVLEYAERVAQLAAEAPNDDAKKAVYRAVRDLRRSYGYSDKEKRTLILDRISVGASSVGDLIKETCFTQPDVWRITKELEAEGIIKLQKVSYSGTGRPTMLFFLHEK